ncbi:uncharacterized protein [Anabrus simplex]|uniref:uncharacterized protein isoform X2 n=1 Tax=Anabrus simplex TaxID=316456 RepID=UPI0035A27E78
MISVNTIMKNKITIGKAKICLFATLMILIYWFSSLHVQLVAVLQGKELNVFIGNGKGEKFKELCFGNKLEPSLEKLPVNLQIWRQVGNRECRSLYEKFMVMYSVEVQEASIKFNRKLEQKVKSWLGNDEKLYKEAQAQMIFSLQDHYNHRFTVYNAVRGKRPATGSHKPNKMFVSEPANDEKSKCDFCHPLTMTAEDNFGRIYGKYSVSAANIFKLNKWHALFITKQHSLFNITEVEFIDLFNTAIKWFKTVNAMDHIARYPVLFWDMFPHAGASQMHVHVHGILGTNGYPGQFGDLFSMTKNFRSKEHSYYWTSVIKMHEALGLVLRFNKVVALAPLVPHRSHELWLISNEPCKELFQLLYYTVKMYQSGLSQFCFSMGGALPVPNQEFDPEKSLPSVIQIGTRGDCSSSVNDISSVELYLECSSRQHLSSSTESKKFFLELFSM